MVLKDLDQELEEDLENFKAIFQSKNFIRGKRRKSEKRWVIIKKSETKLNWKKNDSDVQINQKNLTKKMNL